MSAHSTTTGPAVPADSAWRRAGTPPAPTGQAGHTLIEMIVVMAVAGIIIGIGAPKFLSARHSADRRQFATTANAYVDAIAAFGLDRAGRVPASGPAAADWPDAAKGPIDPLGRPYLRSGAPELVQKGDVAVGGAGVRPGATGHAAIEYIWKSRSTYILRVTEYKGGAATWQCETGTGTISPGANEC